MTRAIHYGAIPMKPGSLFAVLVAVGLAAGAIVFLERKQDERFVIPDEKAAAAALLNEKLSGPRYFQTSAPAGQSLPAMRAPFLRDREPFISVADAKAQVDRLTKERQLDAPRAAKLYQLIDQLAEPSGSRVVGEDSANLLRLNLALDALR